MISDMAAPPIRSPDRRDFFRPCDRRERQGRQGGGPVASESKLLQALHTLRQRPERAIEADILVDAVDGAGLGATNAAV